MPLAYKNLPASKACIKNIFTATAKSTVNVGVYLPEERTIKLVWSDGTVTEGEFTNDATFTESPRLVAPDKAANDYFGCSVSISSDGSIALIGAYFADPGGTLQAGAAYAYVRPDDGLLKYLAADRALPPGVIDVATGEAGTVYEFRGLVVEEGENLAVSASYGDTAVQVQVRGFVED